jgi:hypothetical protein
MARDFLDGPNLCGRPVSESYVNKLVGDIKATPTRWQVTGHSISFCTLPDGREALIDGQDRLEAIECAGISCEILVVRGLEPAARAAIDQGRTRTVAQQVTMVYGVERARDLIAWMNAIDSYFIGLRPGERRTVQGMVAEIDRHKRSVDWAAGLFPRGRAAGIYGRSQVLGALLFAWPTDPSKVGDFATRYLGGEGLRKGEPALVLRQTAERNHGMNSMKDRRTLAFQALRAIEAALDGEKLVQLRGRDESVGRFLKGWDGQRSRARTEAIVPDLPVEVVEEPAKASAPAKAPVAQVPAPSLSEDKLESTIRGLCGETQLKAVSMRALTDALGGRASHSEIHGALASLRGRGLVATIGRARATRYYRTKKAA